MEINTEVTAGCRWDSGVPCNHQSSIYHQTKKSRQCTQKKTMIPQAPMYTCNTKTPSSPLLWRHGVLTYMYSSSSYIQGSFYLHLTNTTYINQYLKESSTRIFKVENGLLLRKTRRVVIKHLQYMYMIRLVYANIFAHFYFFRISTRVDSGLRHSPVCGQGYHFSK